ncbi:hypothetical protein [Arenimonas sp.]|uniref:hypothetical protein n=1 Tax=Arenimonas sp. TaxID=1872635 RepID=UPI0039E4CD6B
MRHLALGLILASIALPASSAVKSSDASSFVVTQSYEVKTDATTAYAALIEPRRWWSSQHSWSGDAKNLSLDARAGGCWCERWNGGEAEHARVIFVVKDKQLRTSGGFGPMQAMALNAVLDVDLTTTANGTRIDVAYTVNGTPASNLDKLAPAVDGVLAEQFGRLQSLLDMGSATKP